MRQRSAPSASPGHLSAEAWIAQMLTARAAMDRVVRRAIAGVDHEIGRDRLVAELRRRGFHLLATRNPFFVVCNSDPAEILF